MRPGSKSREHNHFGRREASCYDAEADHMPRRYRRARAIQNALVCQALRRESEARPTVLDLGAGTANDGVHVLGTVPECFYVGIDQSTTMLGHARRKLKEHGFGDRFALLTLNFVGLSIRAMRAALTEVGIRGQFTVIMSSLAMHHAEAGQKPRIYRTMRGLLGPEGRVVLTDLFRNGIADCESSAIATELRDIRAFERRRAHGPHSELPAATMTADHYRHSNRPTPLQGEVQGLCAAGFRSVDIVFRDGQLATLVAEGDNV